LLIPTSNPKDDLVRFGDVLIAFGFSEKQALWLRLAMTESIAYSEVGGSVLQSGIRPRYPAAD
ncbi:MAG: hypothetical protein AAGB19_12855, partial [Cyanobacteria bacterium P01_F01_bin.3]